MKITPPVSSWTMLWRWVVAASLLTGCRPADHASPSHLAAVQRPASARQQETSSSASATEPRGEQAPPGDNLRGGNAPDRTAAADSQASAPPAPSDMTPEQLCARGQAQERLGKTGEAIASYTAALEADPTFADARRHLGALLIKLERFGDASILYGQLVESDPDNPDAHNDWGVVLVRTGNHEQAITEFREALRLQPDHADAHYNLAVAYVAVGKPSEAHDHLVETLRIHPTYTDAYFMLGRTYLQQEKLDEAIAQFQHVMRLDREYQGLDFQLGRAYLLQDNVRRAVLHFSEAVRRDPLHFEAHLALGMALAKYGNDNAAAAQLREAVRIDADHPDGHFQLAQVLARLGHYEEAITHNDKALTLRPDWTEALNNQAWLLATAPDERLRDPQRALTLARQARQLANYRMASVLDTLAAAQAANGDFSAAVENAQSAATWAADSEQPELNERIKERLESYRSGKPHIEADPQR